MSILAVLSELLSFAKSDGVKLGYAVKGFTLTYKLGVTVGYELEGDSDGVKVVG
jgi:hypothetical protein